MTERVARVRLPDGRIARFSVPEGSSPQQALTYAENYFGKGVTKTEDFGPETMAKSMADASKEMGVVQSLAAGIGTRAMDIDARIRQLLGFGISAQDRQQIEAGRQAPTAVQAGRMAMDIGVGLATSPAGILPNIVAGAAQRFLSDPVLPGESGAQNALEGGIGAGIGYGAARLAQGVARPITPTPQVQALVNEGIVPTLGESAAASGTRTGRMVGRMEEAGTSTFGIGQAIGAGRERALRELNRAALTRATPRGMPVTERVGREGLADTYDSISQVYTDALNRIGMVRDDPTRPIAQDLSRRVNQALVGMPQDAANNVREIIRDTIANRESPVAGAYTAQIAKQVDEDLGARIRDFQNAHGDSTSRISANALRAAQQAWRDLIRRNAPDQATRDSLDEANRAFANYVRVERASTNPGAIEGVFNATQLSRAVRDTAGGGARRAQYGRGASLMEDLSDPARAVLSDRLGESGTIPRGLMTALLSGGLGAGAIGNEQLGGPSFLTMLLGAAAAGPLLYSRPVSRYAIGNLAPALQNPTANVLGAAAPYAGGLGRLLYDPDQPQ